MLITLEDYEQAACSQLPGEVYDYYAGGSGDERTLWQNCSVFEQISLRPRVLRDIQTISLQTTLLGSPVQMPIGIAPVAYMDLAHPEGEQAVAKAAEAAGVPAIMSINASQTLEAIRNAAGGLLWQQCYLYPDRAFMRDMLARIAGASYHALVLTVDRPRLGKRERDLRNHFQLSPEQAANFAGSGIAPRTEICPATWEDIAWLREETMLPLVLKGILTAEDARLAVEHGAAALIVSNHGGRQLDGAITSIEALPEIVAAVAGRCEVYLDGGIRRGTDVFKALALGAQAVFIGRPVLWGLAVNGAPGVQHVLSLLREELEGTMALMGCIQVAEISRTSLALPHSLEREGEAQ